MVMVDAASPNDDKGSRDGKGRFAPGNPGGPGRPRGARERLQAAAEDAITPEHIGAMMRKALVLALQGNLNAMRFVVERVCGRPPDAVGQGLALDMKLPRLRTAADCNAATERLVEGLIKGTVDREAAKVLVDAIQIRIKAIELNDLEQRLADLERTARQHTQEANGNQPDPRFQVN
jgi:hypothetical protein